MAAESFWRVKFKGQEYDLTMRDLTVDGLRELKHAFGPDYGAYSSFIMMLLKGDVDAMAGALWLGMSKRKENPPPPREIKFTLDDFEEIDDEVEAVDEGKDELSADTPTRVSKRTASKSSDPDISSD